MSDQPRRKLIEVALPLEAINVASAREKSIRHGHPSTLHLWWARRPLAACRAVLFASLVDDPSSDPDRFPTPKAVEDERTRLFGIIERLVLWENTTNEVVLEEARAEIRRSTDGNAPHVLDPFCGGGSIPLEAQRLGLEAYASDLNPVAALITKALIEIPPKFRDLPPVHPEARKGVGATGTWKGAAGLAEDVRRYGTWMREEAERRIGHLYPMVNLPAKDGGGEATVIAWIWARTVVCSNPVCRARMPLMRSFVISSKKGKEAWVEPIVDRTARTVTFEVRTGSGAPSIGPKIGRGGSFRCVVCGQTSAEDYIKAQGIEGRMGVQLLAMVADGHRGRIYVSPSEEHERISQAVETSPEELREELSTHPQYMGPPRYGLTRFRDLFTRRQLLALTTFSDLVGEARERVQADAERLSLAEDGDADSGGVPHAADYANAVATYLAFALSKAANYWSSVCSWHQAREIMVSTFGLPVLPMVWDFAEANPLSTSTGNWASGVRQAAEALETLPSLGVGNAVVADARAAIANTSNVLLSTDPPYYDNVPYADLSDFFYVWLRRTVGSLYPEEFATLLTPKGGELVADVIRFGGKSGARQHFEGGLVQAFEAMRRGAAKDYPITIYYAFRQAESRTEGEGGVATRVSTGWETMLEGLTGAGLSIVGTWPVRTEQGGGLREAGRNALASSIVLVCRPLSAAAGITTRKDFIVTLKLELPDAIRTLQHGNIAPVDLAQASIGPGMAIFSRFVKVLEPDGAVMRVRAALSLINQALDDLLTEQEGEFDADTRWAIAWYEQFGLEDGNFGAAETLSKAKNTSVSGLVDAGILTAARGRVRLLSRTEYGLEWNPETDTRVPVWEAMQRLIRALLVDGEIGAASLLSRIGGMGDVARDLAYRLYHVAERKGWSEEARAYNALVVAWPDLVRGVKQARTQEPSQASLGLES